MANYLVAYDLNKAGQNYAGLIKHLESYPNHWHLQKSLWIVGPADNAFSVAEAARPHIDQNDLLFVQALTQDCAWFGYDDAGTKWIRSMTG